MFDLLFEESKEISGDLIHFWVFKSCSHTD